MGDVVGERGGSGRFSNWKDRLNFGLFFMGLFFSLGLRGILEKMDSDYSGLGNRRW